MAFPTHRAAGLPILFRNRNAETGNSERSGSVSFQRCLPPFSGRGYFEFGNGLPRWYAAGPVGAGPTWLEGLLIAPLLIPPELGYFSTGSHVGAGCRRGSHIGTGRR